MTADADSRSGFRCEQCGAALVPRVFHGEDISALVGLRTVLLDDVLLEACPVEGHESRIHHARARGLRPEEGRGGSDARDEPDEEFRLTKGGEGGRVARGWRSESSREPNDPLDCRPLATVEPAVSKSVEATVRPACEAETEDREVSDYVQGNAVKTATLGTRMGYRGEDIEKAIAVVAATLATQARLWTGEEARFVRLLLTGTRAALAALVDASPEEVLAWEEERTPLPRGTEIVIRARLRTLLREERSSLPLPFPALLDKERLPLAATPVFRVRPREVPGL